MTIDDSTLAERTFTATHDRILHALVEQVHDMGLRLNALEAAAAARRDDSPPRLAPPAVPTSTIDARTDRPTERPTDALTVDDDAPVIRRRPTRPTGWQPARR